MGGLHQSGDSVGGLHQSGDSVGGRQQQGDSAAVDYTSRETRVVWTTPAGRQCAVDYTHCRETVWVDPQQSGRQLWVDPHQSGDSVGGLHQSRDSVG